MHGTRIVASGMPEGLYITNLLAIKLSVHIYKFCLPFELVYANVSCNCNECTKMSVLFLLLTSAWVSWQSENTSPYCTVCTGACTAVSRALQTSTWDSESASWQPGSGQFLSKNMSPKSLLIPRTDLVRSAISKEDSCLVRFKM